MTKGLHPLDDATMTDLAQLELDLINAIGAAETAAAVEDLRVAALGKSGLDLRPAQGHGRA